MRLSFALSFLIMFSILNSGCGGSTTVVVVDPFEPIVVIERDTPQTIVIVEESLPEPVQTYTVNITKMSAANPIGDIFVSVTNIYDTDSTASTEQSMTITDKGDNMPITFALKDTAGTIFEQTITLTDYLNAQEITFIDGDNENNTISFTFSIILQTKKQ